MTRTINLWSRSDLIRRSITSKFKNNYSKINTSASSFKLPLVFSRGLENYWKDKIAFTDYTGESFTFGKLAEKSSYLAQELKLLVPKSQERIAFLCDRDFSFPTTLGATWWTQNIAIPLSSTHPDNMLEYILKGTSTKLVVTNRKHADRLNQLTKKVGSQLLVVDYEFLKNEECANSYKISSTSKFVKELDLNQYASIGAVILSTSGTTGKPKFVLLTHGNLLAQVENICSGWEISEEDSMLHVLPLHHTHGLIHALLSPMASGARCHMLENFDAHKTWQKLLSTKSVRATLFTAVPTVFVKLIEEYDKTFANDPAQISFVRKTCIEKMRVFLSGSASLPVPILEKFEQLSGHRILERYGMTETGLILCNPLHAKRTPGHVGTPLKSVKMAVAEMSTSEIKILAEGDVREISFVRDDANVVKIGKISGDLLVKGPSVFKEYWGNPEATNKEFTKDGWFITGDTVEYNEDVGSFKVLGRKSVDIIKSGGYKLSALEIETQLLSLKEVKEVAVLGIQDATWGQKVAALVVWTGEELTVQELRELAKQRLPSYACPQVLKSLPELPRNHLGKVNKKELLKFFSA